MKYLSKCIFVAILFLFVCDAYALSFGLSSWKEEITPQTRFVNVDAYIPTYGVYDRRNSVILSDYHMSNYSWHRGHGGGHRIIHPLPPVVAPVPEPSTLLLLSSGLCSVVLYRWRRKT